MADAVREEECHGSALEEGFAIATQEPELDETICDHEGGRAVDVTPLDARPARGDRGLACPARGLVDERLFGPEGTAHGVGPSDVADISAKRSTRIDEEQVTVSERPRSRREVQDCSVVAGRDDCVERGEVAAVAKERGLERDLQLTLAPAGLDRCSKLREAGACRLDDRTHPFQLDVVLRPPDTNQLVA